MNKNDHITNDEALRQAMQQRAERRKSECPVPADLEARVMQRIEAQQSPASAAAGADRSPMRFVRLLMPLAAAAAILIAFLLWPASKPTPVQTGDSATLPAEASIVAPSAKQPSIEAEASEPRKPAIAQNSSPKPRSLTKPSVNTTEPIQASAQSQETIPELYIAAEMADLRAEMDGLEQQLLSMN